MTTSSEPDAPVAPVASEPRCLGDPGECDYNGACMYACGRSNPPVAPVASEVVEAMCERLSVHRDGTRLLDIADREEAAALLRKLDAERAHHKQESELWEETYRDTQGIVEDYRAKAVAPVASEGEK